MSAAVDANQKLFCTFGGEVVGLLHVLPRVGDLRILRRHAAMVRNKGLVDSMLPEAKECPGHEGRALKQGGLVGWALG